MKSIIIANWKMNPSSLKEAKKLFSKEKKADVVICPPSAFLAQFKDFKGLCAQNCHWEEKGAYTGEISPTMLKNLGVKYVIIGHSERRNYFHENDEIINKKLRAALGAGLVPVLCIGEKSGEDVHRTIESQLQGDLGGIGPEDLRKIIIAYEPVWAIGTGDFCDPREAKKALEFIRRKCDNKILYGGSVNSKIAKNYIEAGFDGLLVGGASLDAEEFGKINENAGI